MKPEPTDKLDAATTVVVNGLEDDTPPQRANRRASRQLTLKGLLEPDAERLARPVPEMDADVKGVVEF